MKLRLRHYLLAIAIHVIVFAFAFIGVRCIQISPPPSTIQGTLVNPLQLKVQHGASKRAAIQEAKREAEIEKEVQLRQRQLTALEGQQRQQGDLRRATQKAVEGALRQAQELANRQKALDQRIRAQEAAEAKLRDLQKAREEARARRLAKQKEEAAARKKAAEAKAKAEAKAREEARARRLAKQKEEAAARKKAAEAEARAEAKKRREALKKRRERALAVQLSSEAKQLKQTALRAWIAAITSKLRDNWVRPPSVQNDISATVEVTLQDNGSVLSVTIEKSSGNPLYDDSVRKAVLKASPLPLPADPQVFDPTLILTFTPNQLQGGS